MGVMTTLTIRRCLFTSRSSPFFTALHYSTTPWSFGCALPSLVRRVGEVAGMGVDGMCGLSWSPSTDWSTLRSGGKDHAHAMFHAAVKYSMRDEGSSLWSVM